MVIELGRRNDAYLAVVRLSMHTSLTEEQSKLFKNIQQRAVQTVAGNIPYYEKACDAFLRCLTCLHRLKDVLAS